MLPNVKAMTRLEVQSGPEGRWGSVVETNLTTAVVRKGEGEENLVDDPEEEV